MSDPQSEMDAAMEEARRAGQKEREAVEALRVRQHEYETAKLRGRQRQIERARAALEAAEAAYEEWQRTHEPSRLELKLKQLREKAAAERKGPP